MNIELKELNVKPVKMRFSPSVLGNSITTITYEVSGYVSREDIELCKVEKTPTTIEELREEYNLSDNDIVKIINDKLK